MTMYECEVGGPDPAAGDNWQAYTTCEEADCAPTCEPAGFFDNVAYPLTISCQDGPTMWPQASNDGGGPPFTTEYIKIDLNNDGVPETVMRKPKYDEMQSSETSNGRVLIGGDKIGTVDMLDIINLNPDVLTYTDYQPNPAVHDTFNLIDFLDVTGDGLVDAIISSGPCDGGMPGAECSIYYVTNISTPQGIACVTDLNNDDVTDTSDLIAGWGPCTQ